RFLFGLRIMRANTVRPYIDVRKLSEEICGEVSFAAVGEHDHDGLVCVQMPPSPRGKEYPLTNKAVL
ncbi:MAG: hypothetical protein IIV43_05045, partial [Oscillospiraceae bacterium]|nr:hypothetical protein [Oscillospiraceae bacterium]